MQAVAAIKPSYRPDVDGLRAVAVLSVIAYHFHPGRYPGGFVGVDVFFVISGYLLSSIVISEVQDNRFSFARFYERRIRRIFPALFFLLLCGSIFACFFLLAPDIASYSRSMIAAALSGSNFYFWRTSDYFTMSSDFPLLHTWSLAVEEQFYLLFPLFIVVTHHYFKKNLRLVVATVTAASFLWSLIEIPHDPSGAFYLPFDRAWEFLIGTLLALRVVPAPRFRASRELVAAGGLLGILLPVFRLTSETPFPGKSALAPCLGAAAVILAGQGAGTLINRALSLRPVVFIGLISYSLYLWHWPLKVFSRISTLSLPHSLTTNRSLLIASLLTAAASWRWVETPFRDGPRKPGRRTIMLFGLACTVVTCIVSFALLFSGGDSRRFPPEANLAASYLNYAAHYPAEAALVFHSAGSCFLGRHQPVADFSERLCLSAAPRERQVLIWGDSHAANLRYGIEAAFPEVRILQATSSACPPTLSPKRAVTAECREFNHRVIDEYIAKGSIPVVLLNARWSGIDFPDLSGTIVRLQKMGMHVVVLGPGPEFNEPLPRLLAVSIIQDRRDGVSSYLAPGPKTIDAAMARLAQDTWHVPYVSLYKLLCPNDVCMEYAAPNVPSEFDDTGHLTLQASVYVGRALRNQNAHLLDGPVSK